MDGKLCSSGERGTDGKNLSLCACVCGSAHDCGWVVDGSNAMVASCIFIYWIKYTRNVLEHNKTQCKAMGDSRDMFE